MRVIATSAVLVLLLAGATPPAHGGAVIAGHAAADAFDQIPAPWFQSVRDHYRFLYGRTSHGSQIGVGIDMLAAENPALYADVTMAEFGLDLGVLGDLNWVTFTRDYLNAHPECNAVMWSWCGGVSTNTPQGIEAYLQGMSRLELDHPGVLFIYMTGHLDGTGPDDLLYSNNNRIRAWCQGNGKTLFDFADIESYDPEGGYYPLDSDACAWCSTWCASHTCPGCADCPHSHCFNCYRKARAFWWMMARARGWIPESTGVSGDLGAATPAHPNPFRETTTLTWSLAQTGAVRVQVVDLAGRVLATLADGILPAGRHELTWDGRAEGGRLVSPGVYFARIVGPGRARTERIVLVK